MNGYGFLLLETVLVQVRLQKFVTRLPAWDIPLPQNSVFRLFAVCRRFCKSSELSVNINFERFALEHTCPKFIKFLFVYK